MIGVPVDMADIATFDLGLLATLDQHASTIRDYMKTAHDHHIERKASDRKTPYPYNPHTQQFHALCQIVGNMMRERMIRAWHYTRLTEDEVSFLRERGIYLSTIESLRERLERQVTAGTLDPETAERLFLDSPLQGKDHEWRSDQFWLVSHSLAIDDCRVEPLMENWGGEAIYCGQRDQDTLAQLSRIGRPRVLEISVPLASTIYSVEAADAVIATFGRELGCQCDDAAFDFYVNRPLGPEHILKIHSPVVRIVDGKTRNVG